MNIPIAIDALAGLLCAAVLFGTDVFFLTVGGPALRHCTEASVTETMGQIHRLGDQRMPVWGVAAMLANAAGAALSKGAPRVLYSVSLGALILFVAAYNRFSKPLNRLQTEAALERRVPPEARSIQNSWDRVVPFRVALLAVCLVAQLSAVFLNVP